MAFLSDYDEVLTSDIVEYKGVEYAVRYRSRSGHAQLTLSYGLPHTAAGFTVLKRECTFVRNTLIEATTPHTFDESACSHKWVDAGFNHSKVVCYKCNVDAPPGTEL